MASGNGGGGGGVWLARMTPHHCEHCLGAAFPDLVSACGPTRKALSTAYGGACVLGGIGSLPHAI